jgi:hypothetical protein
MSYLIGAAALAALAILVRIFAGSWNPAKLVEGAGSAAARRTEM